MEHDRCIQETDSDISNPNYQIKKKIRLLHSAPCNPRNKILSQNRISPLNMKPKTSTVEHIGKENVQNRSPSAMSRKATSSPKSVRESWTPTFNDNLSSLQTNKSGASQSLSAANLRGLSRSHTWCTKEYHNWNNQVVTEQIREMYNQRKIRKLNTSQSPRHRHKIKPRFLTFSEEDKKSSKASLPGQGLQRFRTAVIVVRIVIRWFEAIVENSFRKTPRTAAEQQYYTLYTSLEVQKLAFNKNLFVREQAFARVPKWAAEILGTDPQERPETDCRRIHALLRGLKSFDKFTEQIQLSMCKSFSYQRVKSGRVILRRGHVGFNYYFIYSGSVFVNIEDINIEGKKFDRTVAVLVRGDAFGELALLQNIRRTASITCRENCELLYVDKETFAKVCPQIFEKEMEEKEQFLTSLRVFKNEFWTKEMLKGLCAESQIQQYKTNKVVSIDSEDEEWIYICMEGKCSVIRRLELDKTHQPRKKKRHSTPILSDEIINIITSINKIKEDEEEEEEEEEEESSDEEATKERMLESMALDYRRDGRRKKMEENADDTKEVEKKKLMSLTGPTTLTSLMTQDKKSKDGKDYVYVHIGELKKNEIFNFYAILYPTRVPPNSSVILVSTGAQLMRIRRKVFFKVATKEALAIANNIAKLERFVTDEQLLEAYKEMASWDEFKYKVIQETVRPNINKQTFRKKLTNHQIKVVYDRRERSHKLLKTLQKNHKIAKEIEEKEEQEEKEKRNQLLENLKLKMKSVNDQQQQLCKIVRKDRNDTVIGRRRNVSSTVMSAQPIKPVLQEVKKALETTPEVEFRPKRRMSRRYSQSTTLGACLPMPSDKPIPSNLALDYK